MMHVIFQIIVFLTLLSTIFSYWKKNLFWWRKSSKNFVFTERYRLVTFKCLDCGRVERSRHEDPFLAMFMVPSVFTFLGYLVLGYIGVYLFGVIGVILVHKHVFEEHICKADKENLKGVI